MPVKITCLPDGPYLVEGEIEVVDPTGAPVDVHVRPKVKLCRCGASSQKPMCDGSHRGIGFSASAAAVPQKP